MITDKKETKFPCPMCKTMLMSGRGNSLNFEGISMWCPNPDCPVQEVYGHGGNERCAHEVILSKFKKLDR